MVSVKELVHLMEEHPALPVVPLVDNDVVGDGYMYWLGEFSTCKVGGYGVFKERLYCDKEELEEAIMSEWGDCFPLLNDEQFEAHCKKKASEWWKEAILVFIKPPKCVEEH